MFPYGGFVCGGLGPYEVLGVGGSDAYEELVAGALLLNAGPGFALGPYEALLSYGGA